MLVETETQIDLIVVVKANLHLPPSFLDDIKDDFVLIEVVGSGGRGESYSVTLLSGLIHVLFYLVVSVEIVSFENCLKERTCSVCGI